MEDKSRLSGPRSLRPVAATGAQRKRGDQPGSTHPQLVSVNRLIPADQRVAPMPLAERSRRALFPAAACAARFLPRLRIGSYLRQRQGRSRCMATLLPSNWC